jgi:hypothetical protein
MCKNSFKLDKSLRRKMSEVVFWVKHSDTLSGSLEGPAVVDLLPFDCFLQDDRGGWSVNFSSLMHRAYTLHVIERNQILSAKEYRIVDQCGKRTKDERSIVLNLDIRANWRGDDYILATLASM